MDNRGGQFLFADRRVAWMQKEDGMGHLNRRFMPDRRRGVAKRPISGGRGKVAGRTAAWGTCRKLGEQRENPSLALIFR